MSSPRIDSAECGALQGAAGVTPLLGAFTLESLGLMVNPMTRELMPMRLFLAAAAGARQRRLEPTVPSPLIPRI